MGKKIARAVASVGLSILVGVSLFFHDTFAQLVPLIAPFLRDPLVSTLLYITGVVILIVAALIILTALVSFLVSLMLWSLVQFLEGMDKVVLAWQDLLRTMRGREPQAPGPASEGPGPQQPQPPGQTPERPGPQPAPVVPPHRGRRERP